MGLFAKPRKCIILIAIFTIISLPKISAGKFKKYIIILRLYSVNENKNIKKNIISPFNIQSTTQKTVVLEIPLQFILQLSSHYFNFFFFFLKLCNFFCVFQDSRNNKHILMLCYSYDMF